VYRKELEQVSLPDMDDLSRKMKIWLKQDAKDTPSGQGATGTGVAAQPTLQTVYTMRQELCRLWERSSLTREQLLHELQDWCLRAEQSGIAALERLP
jgi:stearoyl-CoA desaturase (delta-9 desaturase)